MRERGLNDIHFTILLNLLNQNQAQSSKIHRDTHFIELSQNAESRVHGAEYSSENVQLTSTKQSDRPQARFMQAASLFTP